MAQYGASAKRVAARGGGGITDVDIFKFGIVGNCKRGISQVQRDIYSFDDFTAKCGGLDTTIMTPWVVKTMYDELKSDVQVESIVSMFVASDAVQATAVINDQDGTPAKIFDISAAYKNLNDLSAWGNDLAYQIENSEALQYTLGADLLTGSTTCILSSVEHLKVGYHLRFVDGATTGAVVILTIDIPTKTITYAALTGVFTAAASVITRLDWSLKLAVKDEKGIYQEVEAGQWVNQPFIQSDADGMSLIVNDVNTGSEYVKLAVDATNTAIPEEQVPAVVTSWTALSSGSDGTPANDANWNTQIANLADTDSFIVVAPESSSTVHASNMSDYATDGSKWMYYSQASNAATADALKAFGQTQRSSIVYAMLPSDKWKETQNDKGDKVQIPSVGYDAAHWWNTYSETDEEQVAAGFKRPLRTNDKLLDSNGLVHDDKAGVGGRMIEDYSVNITVDRVGIGQCNQSARTFSTDLGYIYQNQVMMFLVQKRSILAFLQSIEQDKSGIDFMTSHRNKVVAYYLAKYNAGMFFRGLNPDGSLTKFEDVITVINDFSINTLVQIANGVEVVFVQYVARPPIEKPQLQLASASVTTLAG